MCPFDLIHSTSRREGGSRSHHREDPRGRQQLESVRAAGTSHHVGYGHRFEHGSISHDRLATTDSFRDRKRSRHDAFTNLPFGNNGPPEAKKFRHSGGSSHGHPRDECCHGNQHRTSSYPLHDGHQKDDHCHGNYMYHKTSTYPSHEHDYHSSYRTSDWSRYSKRGDRELPRVKSVHKQPHPHGSKIPSHQSQPKRRHDDAPPYRLESRLPVGGATSSLSTLSCEVVPYTSSEASYSSGRSGNDGSLEAAVSVVMSIQDCNLVPSLPEKYYRCDGDGVSATV